MAFLPAISLHGEEKFLPTLWTAFCEISSLTTFNTGQGKMDGDFQMFFTGDIGADTEKKLLAAGGLEDVDCLKVGHHGSRYSTTEAFLEKIKPEVAIISCSSTNTYGHPSPETVERLKAAGSQVEYTMKNGAITVETDGKKLKIGRFRKNR